MDEQEKKGGNAPMYHRIFGHPPIGTIAHEFIMPRKADGTGEGGSMGVSAKPILPDYSRFHDDRPTWQDYARLRDAMLEDLRLQVPGVTIISSQRVREMMRDAETDQGPKTRIPKYVQVHIDVQREFCYPAERRGHSMILEQMRKALAADPTLVESLLPRHQIIALRAETPVAKQQCTNCGGEGTVIGGFISSFRVTCRTCNGAKEI